MKTFPIAHDLSEQVRVILGVLGAYLIVFGLLACVWSFRAAWGQIGYQRVLTEKMSPEESLLLARRSFHLYARNYALCIRAAETAYKAGERETAPERAEAFFKDTAYWVTRGLNLNPHLMELHYLKARLQARSDPREALQTWQAYVDWHFWEPRNLAILADFQEAAGREQDARKTRDLLGRQGLDRSGL